MNLNDLSFEEVKYLANNVEGFSFHPRTGEVKLKEDLAVYLEANPDKIPGNDQDALNVDDQDHPDLNAGDQGIPPEPPPGLQIPSDDEDKDEDDEGKTGLVKIQSAYRGEIGSSFGMMDFGTDGICEVSEEAADAICKLEGYERC